LFFLLKKMSFEKFYATAEANNLSGKINAYV
jgi:hypothetical protein